MLINFFRITFRNLWKNRGYSFLNIFGLSIGIACAGLIFLWVKDEIGYDENNLKKESVYLVKTNENVDDGVFTHSSTPGPLAATLQKENSAVVNTCRVSEGGTSLLFSVGDKTMYLSGNYAEPSLFSMFTLPFAEGNSGNPFKDVYSIVITEKTARKLFGGDQNIVGKTVRVDKKQDYIVTGVLKDLPENSTLQFEWLAPFKVWSDANPWSEKWGNF
jgi:putative ABC transport system permease protein